MRRQTARGTRNRRFAIAEVMVVFAIAATVAAIGLPVYASRAKGSVLQQNTDTLASELRQLIASDLDVTYAPDGSDVAGESPDANSVSIVLARILRTGGSAAAGDYVNPLSGSRVIVCQTRLPRTLGESPAVWITDDARCSYRAFVSSPSARDDLAGTLLVVYRTGAGDTSAIDIYPIGSDGRPAEPAETLNL